MKAITGVRHLSGGKSELFAGVASTLYYCGSEGNARHEFILENVRLTSGNQVVPGFDFRAVLKNIPEDLASKLKANTRYYHRQGDTVDLHSLTIPETSIRGEWTDIMRSDRNSVISHLAVDASSEGRLRRATEMLNLSPDRTGEVYKILKQYGVGIGLDNDQASDRLNRMEYLADKNPEMLFAFNDETQWKVRCQYGSSLALLAEFVQLDPSASFDEKVDYGSHGLYRAYAIRDALQYILHQKKQGFDSFVALPSLPSDLDLDEIESSSC